MTAWQIHQAKCQPYCLTCRWQTCRAWIICWFLGGGLRRRQTLITRRPILDWAALIIYRIIASCLVSLTERLMKNGRGGGTKAAETSCHSSANVPLLCTRACVPSGGCNRRGWACHFLIIDNEARWDCGERWRGNGKVMQSDIITTQVVMPLLWEQCEECGLDNTTRSAILGSLCDPFFYCSHNK